jgi:hypothetical protein
MASTAQAEQRRIVRAAAIGMAVVFVAIVIVMRARGLSWSTAAGIAALPTIFGGWFFGALLPLSRRDFSDDRAATATRGTNRSIHP